MNEQVLNLIKEKLVEEVEQSDFYLTHRIGEFKEDRNNPRPITAKFSKYNYVIKCLKIKKLKGKGYWTTRS